MTAALTIISTVATIAGFVAQASAQKKEASRQQAVAEQHATAAEFDASVALENAAIAEQNALLAERQAAAIATRGELDVQVRQRKLRSLIGAQRARFAANGVVVDAGSPILLANEALADASMDIRLIQRGAQLDVEAAQSKALTYRRQAGVERKRSQFQIDTAKEIRRSGAASAAAGSTLAGATLLTGAGQLAGQFGEKLGSG